MSQKNTLRKKKKLVNPILEVAAKDDYFVGSNVEKPVILTADEVNLSIQSERVVRSFTEAINVLTVMSYLPYLLDNNASLLKKFLTVKDYNFAMEVLQMYGAKVEFEAVVQDHSSQDTYDVSYRDMLYNNKIRTKESHPPTGSSLEVDMDIKLLVDILYSNKCIKYIVKSHRDQIPQELTIKGLQEFIAAMADMKTLANTKLFATGTEEEEMERNLRAAYKSNTLLRTAIKELNRQLEEQRKELGKELQKKVAIYEMYKNKISDMKNELHLSTEECVYFSEKHMMEETVASDEKQVGLAEEAKMMTNKYETLLEDDLNKEKQLRAKTLKTETQLLSWLAKFDQDIGDKQQQYEELEQRYNDEKAAIEELEEQMEEHDEIYQILMAEKEEEDEAIRNELAYQFLLNRSARLIQRTWRAYWERKLARKKARRSKRKDKKGKK